MDELIQMFDGEVAVVTGGGSGIGRAVCQRLAAAGAAVAVSDIDVHGAEQTTVEISESGGRSQAYELDVTDNQSVQRLVSDVGDSLGVPSIVVNVAGIDEIGPFLEDDPEYWDRLVAINFLGVVRVCRAFLPALIDRQTGAFVNIASDAGRVGSTGEVVYSGTKGGVIAFTKGLAREAARHSIRANSVCPGPTETPMFYKQPEKLREALVRATPMRRLAQPSEIADAVLFFASPLSRFTTGQVLSVSGGLTMAG